MHTHIYGTNYVGAEKILRKLTSTIHNTKLNNWILEEKIKWSFNSSGALHYGGLWRQHLNR